MYLCICVCVCVCEREREREREKQFVEILFLFDDFSSKKVKLFKDFEILILPKKSILLKDPISVADFAIS